MSAFVGEHSSKLMSRGSSCHRTHDVTKGHMTRSVPSTTTLEKELSGCSKIVETHTNADRCVHTDSAKAVDESILFSEKLQERANPVNEDRAVPTEPVLYVALPRRARQSGSSYTRMTTRRRVHSPMMKLLHR